MEDDRARGGGRETEGPLALTYGHFRANWNEENEFNSLFLYNVLFLGFDVVNIYQIMFRIYCNT